MIWKKEKMVRIGLNKTNFFFFFFMLLRAVVFLYVCWCCFVFFVCFLFIWPQIFLHGGWMFFFNLLFV